MTSKAISAAMLFEQWARERQSASAAGRRLSQASVTTWRWAWKSWCDFLQQQALPWQRAQPEDVHKFLRSLEGSRVRRVRLPDGRSKAVRAHASGVTRARYARILQQLYSSALRQGLVAANPVRSDALARDRGESLVLNQLLWHQLAEAAAALQLDGWIAARDRALLLTMLQLALTVSELRALTLGDVTHPRLRPQRAQALWQQRPLEGLLHAHAPVRLMVRGDRTQQSRRMDVPEPAAAALGEWLQLRLTGLPGAPCALNAPLFVSRKGFGALTPKTLFIVANTHIGRTLRRPLPHAGPNVLRNACIARWLSEGMAREHAAALAGLKDAASLARLPQ